MEKIPCWQWQLEFYYKIIAAIDDELWNSYSDEVKADHFPLALQSTGEQVACCMAELKAVSVRDARSGAELRRRGALSGGDMRIGDSGVAPSASASASV